MDGLAIEGVLLKGHRGWGSVHNSVASGSVPRPPPPESFLLGVHLISCMH